MTATSSVISTASHQWNRAASMIPQPTPIGVVTISMGLAIRMAGIIVDGRRLGIALSALHC